jgi:hypothetical protein
VEVVAAKVASGDGRSGRSTRRRSVDRGLNDGLLFGDSWSCGLRTVCSRTKEAHERRGGWWLGERNDGFLSGSSVAMAEVNARRAGARREQKEKKRGSSSTRCSSYSCTRRWLRKTETVGENGGRNGGEAMGKQVGGRGPNAVGTTASLFGPCR